MGRDEERVQASLNIKRESKPGYLLLLFGFRIAEALGMRNPREHRSRMPVKEGAWVLDWGSGPGLVTIPLAKKVGEEGKVIAPDIQPLALRAVRKKAARRIWPSSQPASTGERWIMSQDQQQRRQVSKHEDKPSRTAKGLLVLRP